MTIVTANMLSGLAGSDPALIAKVVELINNPALTSLNALRDGLANGTWTVRVATAADNIGRADGQFLDPQGGAPGQILVRPNLLSVSDPKDMPRAVLDLIDTLVHEGVGHGDPAMLTKRQAADRVLADSNLSAMQRAEGFMQLRLDDESAARYEAWEFRTELEGLNDLSVNEYHRANRVELITNDIYKALSAASLRRLSRT